MSHDAQWQPTDPGDMRPITPPPPSPQQVFRPEPAAPWPALRPPLRLSPRPGPIERAAKALYSLAGGVLLYLLVTLVVVDWDRVDSPAPVVLTAVMAGFAAGWVVLGALVWSGYTGAHITAIVLAAVNAAIMGLLFIAAMFDSAGMSVYAQGFSGLQIILSGYAIIMLSQRESAAWCRHATAVRLQSRGLPHHPDGPYRY